MGHSENAIVRNLERQGFEVTRMRKHITMRSPLGVRVTIPCSMGRRGRSLANTVAMIKRAGGSAGGKPKRGGRPGMV